MPVSGRVPTHTPKYLFKIVTPADLPPNFPISDSPNPLSPSTALPRTELDRKDSFIHLATPAQVSFVLNKFYTSGPIAEHAVLFKIDYEAPCGLKEGEGQGEDVRWEVAGDYGQHFAHVYGGEVWGKYVLGMRERRRREDGKENWEDNFRDIFTDLGEWLAS